MDEKARLSMRLARIDKKLTQDDIAKRVGVNRVVITNLENDPNYHTTPKTAKAISELLDLDWTTFF